MIRIADDDFAAVCRRWIIFVLLCLVLRPGETASAGLTNNGVLSLLRVAVTVVERAHQDGMLFGFALLVLMDKANHMILPFNRLPVTFVGYLIEDIVQVIQRVHDLPHIDFLHCGNRWYPESVGLLAFAVSIRIAVDPVDIIFGLKGMPRPRVRSTAPFVVNGEPLEKHHHDIDSLLLRFQNP